MRSCQVPTPYIHLINCMLSDRQTQLCFNDFTSEPILLSNGTTQGCPLSMLLYAFYNMELIEIAHGKNKLAAGFVDNCAFVATADNLNNSHRILKDMMECPNGVLNWSLNHNSKFEISKFAIMDFPHPHKAEPSTPLIIKQRLEDGTTTTNTITNVQNYRYLGKGWKTSPHCHHMGRIDKSIPSKKWMKLTKSLSHKQASIVMQLHTGHIGVNKHLHQIKCSELPHCPNCDKNAIETVHHFLFNCT